MKHRQWIPFLGCMFMVFMLGGLFCGHLAGFIRPPDAKFVPEVKTIVTSGFFAIFFAVGAWERARASK